MKYRSRVEIIAAMLRTMSRGAKKRAILCGAYLSYSQMEGYLEFLLRKELVYRYDHDRTYVLSEKGLQFLQAYESMETLTGVYQPGLKKQRRQAARVAEGQKLTATA